jgi:putative oxidoreductase
MNAARLQQIRARLTQLEWVPQLLMRVFLGAFFAETGWGKVTNLPAMTERFADWGIPFPAFSAALSGYTELIGGVLVLVGLGTRLVSIPMVINLAVAVLTVKLKKVTGWTDFVELDEPLYALGFFWLIFSGPGWVSLDHLLVRWLEAGGKATASGSQSRRPTSGTRAPV